MNRGWSYRGTVGPESAGRTLLDYLAITWPHSTAAEWAERLGRGEIEIHGVRADAGVVVRMGQSMVWHRPPWHEPDVPAYFDLVHEDEALVAVAKPSGLPTMPAGGYLEHTLLALVRARYPEASPLHRLGRCTSGMVLFARTHAAVSALARAWREHDVKKRYRALACGAATRDTFSIDTPIGRVPHPALGEVYAASASGKPSHSVVTVLERRHAMQGGAATLFQVDITTGRPHQIRIHLASAGHPLVGDPLYGAGGLPLLHRPGLPGDGGYLLHAEQLAFVHPVAGHLLTLRTPPPVELQVLAAGP